VPVWSLLYKHSVTQKYTMEFWLVHHIIAHSFLLITCLSIIVAIMLDLSLQLIILISLPFFSLSLFIPKVYKTYLQKYG